MENKTELFKMPKNIRQIGVTGQSSKSIYVEDYVISYMKQLATRHTTDLQVAILLGYGVKTELGSSLFIKGAVDMEAVNPNSSISLSEEGWTKVYESIKEYFTDVEIVGWAIIGTEFFLESKESIRKLHCDNFGQGDKALLKVESLEGEETFYFLEKNQLVKQTGYYIYYEKNEEMQTYMVENKETISVESTYIDKTTSKIRNIIKEKQSPKEEKGIMGLLYTASTLMAVIILVVAYTILDNHKQIKSMEETLQTLSNSIQNDNEDVEEDDDSEEQSEKQDNKKKNKGEAEEKDEENDDADESSDEDTKKETGKEGTSKEKDVDEDEYTGGNQSDNTSQGENDDEANGMEIETVSGDVAEKDTSNKDSSSQDSSPKQDASSENKDSSQKETTASKEKTIASNKDQEKPKEKEPEKEQPVSSEPQYYTVQSGDSLAGISLKLYQSVNQVKTIKELNGIEDEDKIYAGQKLRIP